MRKLASIQKILALEPIEGADAIVKATVLGWQLVVKKGEFEVGDWCVYCEVDSLFPDQPEFEFLKPRGMRIRTIRLRGQVSQGICFPLSILPPGTAAEEDRDVSDLLGVTKYEAPIPASLAGVAKGNFPGFIPKTDETRVQVLQSLLTRYRGEPCYVTEKLDGTSVTYYTKDGHFGVCSRNLELLETPENSLWNVAKAMDIASKLRDLPGNYALQGELIGEGVQGNRYQMRGQSVRFFNAFDIDRYAFLDWAAFQKLMQQLDLPTVPVLTTDFALTDDITELVTFSQARSVLNPKVWREGIVIRPLVERQDARYGRVSFKVINPEFLLKYE